MSGRPALGLLVAASIVAALAATRVAVVAQTPAITRAVSYLAAEVPRWRREHPCYSCHNNGDATRALIAASARGYSAGDALADTLAWLATPEQWDSNARRGGSEELPLARIQFAAALAAMVDTGRAEKPALDRAARLLAGHQQSDGSFRLSDSQLLGGATFYGTSLATAMARNSLARATTPVAREAVAKADRWLRNLDTASVLDASSIVIGIGRATDAAAAAQRAKAFDTLKRGQGPDGGWGPYVNSASEPFDTALAILALTTVRDAAVPQAVARARAYLTSLQNDDGSWPETTRPPNGESYAQRISTTAWVLMALIETE